MREPNSELSHIDVVDDELDVHQVTFTRGDLPGPDREGCRTYHPSEEYMALLDEVVQRAVHYGDGWIETFPDGWTWSRVSVVVI